MADAVEVHEGLVAQATVIAAHLPAGPFSVQRFLDHATGLNVLHNAAEVDAILEYLTDAGVLQQLGTNRMWITV